MKPKRRKLRKVVKTKQAPKGINRKKLKTIAIALYITFILLSAVPFVADKTVEVNLKTKYDYHLVYRVDGRQSHYYVERSNTNQVGLIDLTYTTETNSLEVDAKNIKILEIYCRSMYKDECQKVFGFDPSENSNYYKWYFIEKNHLTVTVNSDTKFNTLAFIDTPIPYEVYVNGLRWLEGRQYNYTDSYGTILSNVPKGTTHVDIFFKSSDNNRPVADFDTDKKIANIDTIIFFDANSSYDPDGFITSYIWDFGDGNNSGGVVNAHSYSTPGTYLVILTVRDNDFLIDHAYLNMTVVKGSTKPVINGIVPNQIKEEDSPVWELELGVYGLDFDGSAMDLRWYLTGTNNSLYHVIGQNSTDQKLIFSVIPNANGNDLVTIWLKDQDGHSTNQELWINITPVNDKPVIEKLPDMIVHHDVPYVFLITNYIFDVETPREELTVTAQDKFGNEYITIHGQEIIFEYPEELLNEVILVTVVVSDGLTSTSAILSVSVTNNWPPVLEKKLPDIALDEGTAKNDAFKLDEYFSDPDDDELYFTYSLSNVVIIINTNNSVDIISRSQWTGDVEVIFRARDVYGAFTEDTIKITVIPINDPPSIGNIPDLMVHFDMDYYFDVSFYISDNDNELEELTLISSDPSHIRISPNNNLGIIMNYPKSMLGLTSNVVFTVFDGQLSTSKTTSVKVIAEYPPELIKKLPDVTFKEDESVERFINLGDHFLDLDNDTLYYTTGNKMINITIFDNHDVSFRAPSNWFGAEVVIFRATDPVGALVEDLVHVMVLPVNDPPLLKPLPEIRINESETIEFNLGRYISDVDNNQSSLILIVDDPNVFISGTSIILFGSKKLPEELIISVSDGELTDARILKIKVISKEPQTDDTVSNVIIFFILLIIGIISVILLILRHNFIKNQKFDIEEIFLIHNSGKLLNHHYLKTQSKFDDEIFSGMFTAIQGFIEDTFINNAPEQLSTTSLAINTNSEEISNQSENKSLNAKLNEFKVGDNQVIIEHGKYIFMAVVYRGPGTKAIHKVINNMITEIEDIFGMHLEHWDGDIKKVAGIKQYLEKLMPDTNRKAKGEESNEHQHQPTNISSEKVSVQTLKNKLFLKH